MNLRSLIASRPVFFFITAIEGLFLLVWIGRIPPDQKNQVWLGFSVQRLLLIGGMLLLIALLTVAGFASLRTRSSFYRLLSGWLANRPVRGGLKAASIFLALLGWLCAFLPGYQLGPLQYYFERLQPGLIWLGLTGLQLLIAITWSDGGPYTGSLFEHFRQERQALAVAGIALLACLLVWAFVLITRIGITTDNLFWNVAGVPVLGVQMYLSWMGLTACLLLARQKVVRQWFGRWQRVFDGGMMVGLWAAAFLLWMGAPLLPYVTNPKPIAPNYEYYPYSDAIYHDMGGQYILLGQGVYNHAYTDKPLYMLLLAGFHALAGQNYTDVIRLQVALLALIPVALYVFGRSMQSRALGAMAGILAIGKECNALASVIVVSGSNTKQMMTEPFTELGVIVFTWLVFRWFKHQQRSKLAPLWAGGALGLTTLIRPNPFLLWPIIIAFALLVYWKAWRRWLVTGALMTAVMALVMLPWVVTSTDTVGNSYFKLKFLDVFYVRYMNQSYLPPTTTTIGTPILAAGRWGEIKLASVMTDLRQQAVGATVQLKIITEHTLHNVVASVLIMPNSINYGDLLHTLNQPYWVEVPAWTGTVTGTQAFFVLIDLGVIACGIGWAWKRARWAGLTPVVVFFGYALANGFAKTSGSRYLVPMDWVVYFYSCAGLIFLTEAAIVWLWGLGNPEEIGEGPANAGGFPLEKSVFFSGKAAFPYGKAAGLALSFLAIGSLLPWVSVAVPQRYAPLTQVELAQQVALRIDPRGGNVAPEAWKAFLQAPDTQFVQGLALYPRYFQSSRGEFEFFDLPYEAKGFDRLIVETLSPNAPKGVILPVSQIPGIFPNGSDLLAVGCKNNDTTMIAVAFVVRSGGKERVYWAAPMPAELTCTAMGKIY